MKYSFEDKVEMTRKKSKWENTIVRKKLKKVQIWAPPLQDQTAWSVTLLCHVMLRTPSEL